MRLEVLSDAAQLRAWPLERLLKRIRDETEPPRYIDQLSLLVLPYLHPKPTSTLTAKCSFEMTDEELEMVCEREKAYQAGELAGQIVRLPPRQRGW